MVRWDFDCCTVVVCNHKILIKYSLRRLLCEFYDLKSVGNYYFNYYQLDTVGVIKGFRSYL